MLKTLTVAITVITVSATTSFADETKTSPSAAEVMGQKLLADWERKAETRPSPTAAHAAIAAIAGVQSEDYSHHEIVQMLVAKSSGSASVMGVAMNKLNGVTPKGSGHVSAGERALARQLGLSAASYTLNELATMKFAADN
ncbi:MAG: hypothetical protein AAGA08_01655 [Pseudomonadota bacterium]